MSVYQSDPDRAPDSDYLPGEPAFLVPGNHCRMLDARRTPGVIEAYDPEAAMFRWRIGAFEDEGRYWDNPAELVYRCQFAQDSARLSDEDAKAVEAQIKKFSQPLVIEIDEQARQKSEADIEAAASEATAWLSTESEFFSTNESLDLDNRTGPASLAQDFLRYMDAVGLRDIEETTAEWQVINPYSGEWIKGMKIMLAEMGLIQYVGTVTRTTDIWQGRGEKATRRNYIVHRLGFVRAMFRKLGMPEVALYRGMASEGQWVEKNRSLVSMTFSLKVAEAHIKMEREPRFRHSYLIKRTIPVERIFMTYLETAAMNRQYLEAEALVLRGEELFW